MGYGVAEAATRRGAKVVLVSGPTSLDAPGGVERITVRTAEEMHRAVTGRFAECSIAILAAAEAEYRAVEKPAQKKKRQKTILTGQLQPTKDIVADVAKVKSDRVRGGVRGHTWVVGGDHPA